MHIYIYRWIYKFITKCIPFTFLQSWMIEKHFALCPACKEAYAHDGFIGPVGFTAQRVQLPENNAREILGRIDERRSITQNVTRPIRRHRLQLAVGVLVLTVLVPLFLFVKEGLLRGGEHGEEFRYREIVIRHVSVENKPANVIYFQPEQPDRVIVWINKRNDKEVTESKRRNHHPTENPTGTGIDEGGDGRGEVNDRRIVFESSEESSAM